MVDELKTDNAAAVSGAGDLLNRRDLALALADLAPIVYFDGAPTSGRLGGVGNITLNCAQHVTVDGKTWPTLRTVAHLRFPLEVIPVLRQALDNIEFLATPPASGEKN